MNSNPTRPSGISSSASTRLIAEIAMTAGRCSSAHSERARNVPLRSALEPRRERFDDRPRPPRESSDQRPASAGVTVNETNSEVSVATVTTRPNSRRNRPTEPGKNEIGKNTTTSTSVITIAATPISRAAADRRGLLGLLAAAAVAFDVLEHDDRVVDQDADDQRHRQQRHHVDREVARASSRPA